MLCGSSCSWERNCRIRSTGKLGKKYIESSWSLTPKVYFKELLVFPVLIHTYLYTPTSLHTHTQQQSSPLLIVWLQSFCILTPLVVSTHLPLLNFRCICHFHPLIIFDPLADNDEFSPAAQELAKKSLLSKV